MANHRRGLIFTLTVLTVGFLAGFGLLLSPHAPFTPRTTVEKFFPGTDQEVRVYHISGYQKSPTLLIVGGIQGDETAGYLTADRYLDLKMKKGTLIIVPRLNLPSIMAGTREGLTPDMNRLFHLSEAMEQNPDTKVVNLAKSLIRKADYVLNLHQGSGFYSPVWISNQRNPSRWGQSNIIDAPTFSLPNGEKLELEKFAGNVAKLTNTRISSSAYQFKVNNTETASEDSLHKEQRQSLTFYALTGEHKMALGLEATKSCPVPEAVSFLTMAVNSVIQEAGIIPESLPNENIAVISAELAEEERLQGLNIKVNNKKVFIPVGEAAVYLNKGDKIQVLSVAAKKPHQWFVRLASSTLGNGIGQVYQVNGNDKLIVRNGPKVVAVVDTITSPSEMEYLEVEINGKSQRYKNNETISLRRNAKMEFIRVFPEPPGEEIKVNLKGFVGSKDYNDGQDLGYTISVKDLMPQWAIGKARKIYPIEITRQDKPLGELFLKVE
ncbi:MAG: M99 family carboxypeptidase catalytic domain-containing protein [Candidatus Omnitrophota bacterium]